MKCQARKIPRLTHRWSIIAMPFPESRGVGVSVGFIGLLPVTTRGNTYILMFTYRFIRLADMSPVTATESTVQDTANNLVIQYICFWGCPRTILPDNGLRFRSRLSQAVHQCWVGTMLLQAPSNPSATGALSGKTTLWAKHWLSSSKGEKTVRAGMFPTYSYLTTFPSARRRVWRPTRPTWANSHCFPLVVFDKPGVVGNHNLDPGHLVYCDLATDRQKSANDNVRAHHALTVSIVNRRNSALDHELRPAPKCSVGCWSWVYGTASTIRQVGEVNTDAKALKSKFAFNWTGRTKSWPSVPAATPTPRKVYR